MEVKEGSEESEGRKEGNEESEGRKEGRKEEKKELHEGRRKYMKDVKKVKK